MLSRPRAHTHTRGESIFVKFVKKTPNFQGFLGIMAKMLTPTRPILDFLATDFAIARRLCDDGSDKWNLRIRPSHGRRAMLPVQIEKLAVKGFKTFSDASIEFHSSNVLIGGNGAGKSNLLSLLKLILLYK